MGALPPDRIRSIYKGIFLYYRIHILLKWTRILIESNVNTVILEMHALYACHIYYASTNFGKIIARNVNNFRIAIMIKGESIAKFVILLINVNMESGRSIVLLVDPI